VPNTHPKIASLKRGYTYMLPTVDESNQPSYLNLWKEAPNHLIIPRTAKLDLDITDLRPNYNKVNPKLFSRIKLDYKGGDTQKKSVDAALKAKGGVLNLACGKGKTVVILEAYARNKVPGLVIVHTKDLMEQWEDRINEFLGSVTIGRIQGPPRTWDWKKDITLASIQTLHRHSEFITPEMTCYFGMVIFDEVHHIPAEAFSITADMFIGDRYGLTATTQRGDGREPIIEAHIGKVFYSDLSMDLKPRIFFQFTPIVLNLKSREIAPQIRDRSGQVNMSMLRSFVGMYDERNEYIVDYLEWINGLGRKVLALSHSRDQIYKLKDMLAANGVTEVGVCTGLEEGKTRLESLRKYDLNLGTAQLAKEFLDLPELDTLVLLSPFGRDVRGENALQQSMGRVLRPVRGKDPVVIVFHDIGIGPFHRMSKELSRILDHWPSKKGGPLDYKRVDKNSRPDI
jgi:superfamily II DNA or RNA helicase